MGGKIVTTMDATMDIQQTHNRYKMDATTDTQWTPQQMNDGPMTDAMMDPQWTYDRHKMDAPTDAQWVQGQMHERHEDGCTTGVTMGAMMVI
jgi:hypothetical protein